MSCYYEERSDVVIPFIYNLFSILKNIQIYVKIETYILKGVIELWERHAILLKNRGGGNS